jgi:hypothetical protein
MCCYWEVHENQVGLKLNGTLQLLAYADDVDRVEAKIDTIKRNWKSIIDTSKEICLEVNTEKTEYILLSRY